jgi:hypothetical protein
LTFRRAAIIAKKTCCCANEFNIENDQNVKAWWAMLTMLMFKLE